MNYSFIEFNIKAENAEAIKAAEFFKKELNKRTSLPVALNSFEKEPNFQFVISEDFADKDCYKIDQRENIIIFHGKTIRALIFGYSHFLRKMIFKNGEAFLTENINGIYCPQKKIRGHQTAYRTTPNTYDAWSYEQFFDYYLDLMAFGMNTVEHNGTKPKENFRNSLMKYEQYEFLAEASRLADIVDLDVSLWQANDDDETEEEALAVRDMIYKSMPRLNIVFPPGGDPGELTADVFVDRCKKIEKVLKKHHPEAELHPSSQAPHTYKDWGEIFASEMEKEPEEFSAIIMGPNHAFPIHELRKRIPQKYPLRFYPDITHNVRCEYPVNFLEDDWHYAYAATLSRESINPRPTELRTLHRIFSPYTIGSVSYSEGAHDDLNKAVWSALEFNQNTDLKEIILDYARYFLYGADEEKIADCIFMLEKNWQGAPEENPVIDACYKAFCELKADYPHLNDNWRFVSLYFRACCDKLVKERRVFELGLIKNAEYVLKKASDSASVKEAIEILSAPFTDSYKSLREEIDYLAGRLFELIGMQLDVEHYCAESWERGATLETIDNNITDRAYLISKLSYALTLDDIKILPYINELLNCRKCNPGEVYYSVALHGLNTLGIRQDGEFYMDVYADKPFAKEKSMPMAMTKVFDHFTFSAKFGGFIPETDYTLKIAYKSDKNENITHHTVKAGGEKIYEGSQYGGKKNEQFDKDFLVPGFESATYILPKEVFKNGALDIEISEPIDGFKLCELWIKPIK